MYCTDFCFQDPFFLEKAIICCEQDWEQEYFEIHEFGTKDSYIFKVSSTRLFNVVYECSQRFTGQVLKLDLRYYIVKLC